jgi:hypothetical protein
MAPSRVTLASLHSVELSLLAGFSYPFVRATSFSSLQPGEPGDRFSTAPALLHNDLRPCLTVSVAETLKDSRETQLAHAVPAQPRASNLLPS